MAHYFPREKEFKPDRTPTVVEITARIMMNGKHCQPGEQVTVPMCDALYVQSMGRCRILKQPPLEEQNANNESP